MDLIDRIKEIANKKYSIKDILDYNKLTRYGEICSLIAIKINNCDEKYKLECIIKYSKYKIMSILSTVHMLDVNNNMQKIKDTFPTYVVITIINNEYLEFNKCSKNSIIHSKNKYTILNIDDIMEV